MRILVVDDEEMIRTLAVKILEQAGHEVITAESGREGIELVMRNPDMIDVVVVDQVMPGLTGFETIKEIHKHFENLPCILSSGAIDSRSIPEDLQNRTSFLQKPYQPQTLVASVKTARVKL